MKNEMNAVKTDNIEHQRGGSRTSQTVATLIVSLGMGMFGYVNGWTSPTIELFLSSETPVPLTQTQLSWVMGAAPLGAVFGTLPSALLMNHVGRRGTLLLLNVLPMLSWILTYYATSFPLLFTARVLAGSGVGACFTVVPNYISEIVDPDLRSSMNTLPCLMQRLGTLAVFTLGTYSSYWILSLIGLTIGSFYWIILLTIPESPYFYLMKNNEEMALKSLVWLHNNNNIDEKFHTLRRFIYADLQNKASLFDLLENSIHFKNLMKVTLATVFTLSSGGVLIVVLPILIPHNSVPYITNKECSIIGAVIGLLFSFRPQTLTLASNRLSLIVSGTVCGLCMATMAIWCYFENKSELVKVDFYWLPFVSYLIHIMFYSMYMYPTVMGLRGEMFPSKFKNTLSAFVASVATVTIYVILQAFIPLRTHFGGHFNFIIGCVASFSLVLLTYFCLMETEGKSLQDIQNDLHFLSGDTIPLPNFLKESPPPSVCLKH